MSENPEPPVVPVSVTLHATVALFLFAFVTIVVLSITLEIDIVARGRGKVTPLAGVRPIQSEYAARVVRTLVREGDRVREGDLLMELDSTDARAEVDSLESELSSKRDRLEAVGIVAEAVERLVASSAVTLEDGAESGEDHVDEARVRARRPSVSARQRDVIDTKLAALQRIEDMFESRVQAARVATEVTRESLDGVEDVLELQKERLWVVKKLLEEGNTSRSDYLDVLEASRTLGSRHAVLLKELEQQLAERDVLQAERSDAYASRHGELVEQGAGLATEIDLTQDALLAARKRLRNAKLHSPLDGTVGSVSALVRGGVVEAGAELLRVVPTNTFPEIEALFENADIGFLDIGQQATISFDAFPAARFGTVDGVLTRVSADAQQGASDDAWRFAARIVPVDSLLAIEGADYAMRPGMTVTVDVATGSRRLISYFLAPMIDTLRSSLRER